MKKAQLLMIIGLVGLVLVFATTSFAAANLSGFIKDDIHAVKDGKKIYDVYYALDISFEKTGSGTAYFTYILAYTAYGRQVEMDRWSDFPSNCYYLVETMEFDFNGHYRITGWQFLDYNGRTIGEDVDITYTNPPWQKIKPNSMAERWEKLCRQHI